MPLSDVYVPVTLGEDFNRKFIASISSRLYLREIAGRVISEVKELSRMANCGDESKTGISIIVPKNANPYFNSHCCGGASCPYCASRKGAKRLHDLEDAILSFQQLYPFGMVAMLVLTFSHCVTDSLNDIGSRFREAKKAFFRDRIVREVFQSLGCIGRVSAPETTWSISNGFHPHEHILFFLSNVTAETLSIARQRLFPYWENACRKFGLVTVRERFYFEFGYTSNLKDYVTKCAREVTLSDCKKAVQKNGVSHYAPFQLLSVYGESGDNLFGEKFREYALYSKGLKSHNWSRGLAKTLNVKQRAEKSDNEEEKEIMKNGLCILFHPESVKDFTLEKRLYLLELLSRPSDLTLDKKLIRFLDGTRKTEFRNMLYSVRNSDAEYLGEMLYDVSGAGGVS